LRHRSNLYLWIGAQDFEGIISGAIVKNDVSLDKPIVVPKEKSEHLGVIPTSRVQIDPHGWIAVFPMPKKKHCDGLQT
jgi:hypothetical protein